ILNIRRKLINPNMIIYNKISKIIVVIAISSTLLLSQYVHAQNSMISSADIRSVKIISACTDSISPLASYLQNYLRQRSNKVDNRIYCELQKNKKISQFVLATEES